MSDVLPRPRQNNKSANNYEKCSLSCRFNSTASTNTYCYRDTHTALTGDDYSSFRHISSLASAQYSSISPFHAKYSNQYSYFFIDFTVGIISNRIRYLTVPLSLNLQKIASNTQNEWCLMYVYMYPLVSIASRPGYRFKLTPVKLAVHDAGLTSDGK